MFDELPAGEGDLVVRLRVETDLEPSFHATLVEDLVFAGSLGAVAFWEFG